MAKRIRPSALERFTAGLSYPDGEDGCWLFRIDTQSGRYGQITDDDRRSTRVHRWSYEHFVGPIPEDYEVDHLCRVTRCARPSHLEAVTQAENLRRMNAAVTHCPQGHEYTAETTYVHNGKRSCKPCVRARTRAWQEAKKAEARAAGFTPWKQRTHCVHGHEFTPENTLTRGPVSTVVEPGARGGHYRECRTCIAQRAAAKRPALEPKVYCKRGHAYGPDDVQNGGAAKLCKTCKRDHGREWMRRKRAARAAASLVDNGGHSTA